MKQTYLALRQEARRIIKTLPPQVFHTRFSEQLKRSEKMLHTDPLLTSLTRLMLQEIKDNFGHGKRHTELVGLDAGVIVQVELLSDKTNKTAPDVEKAMRLVQAAAILHDIRRKEPDHALRGAAFAADLLRKPEFQMAEPEIAIIRNAIENHEAFKPQAPASTTFLSRLISDALYDADKFRWGPDNFTHTVWDMVIYANIPLDVFIKKFPEGMAKLAQIKGTFRTETGKHYGPDIIDMGITTGNRLFAFIRQNHPEAF